MKHKINRYASLLILLFTSIFAFSSCGTSCWCNKDLGCTILIARNTNGTVLSTKTFCSQTAYYTDTLLQDSVRAFILRYQSASTIIDQKDSIYKYETIYKIKNNKTSYYVDSGYDCNCAK